MRSWLTVVQSDKSTTPLSGRDLDAVSGSSDTWCGRKISGRSVYTGVTDENTKPWTHVMIAIPKPKTKLFTGQSIRHAPVDIG